MKSSIIVSKFLKFKQEYQHLYPKEAWNYIENNFYEYINEEAAPDILMQIYHYLDINTNNSFYTKHFNIIKNLFPLDGNIIEVGSGNIPALANLIASHQLNINEGTITIYEPLILKTTSKYPNMTIKKEEFSNITDISNCTLLTGLLTCEATESIITNACINHKDFYIAMCGCSHSCQEYVYTTPELYQELIIDIAKKNLKKYDNGILEITSLKNYPINYPILYNRR